MKRNEFTDSFQPMVPTLPREYVEGIYDRIKADELKIATEDAMTAAGTATAAPSGNSTNNNGDADGKGKGLKGFFSRFF
jgi:Sec7-like guanine-nucleotide exchange factor